MILYHCHYHYHLTGVWYGMNNVHCTLHRYECQLSRTRYDWWERKIVRCCLRPRVTVPRWCPVEGYTIGWHHRSRISIYQLYYGTGSALSGGDLGLIWQWYIEGIRLTSQCCVIVVLLMLVSVRWQSTGDGWARQVGRSDRTSHSALSFVSRRRQEDVQGSLGTPQKGNNNWFTYQSVQHLFGGFVHC